MPGLVDLGAALGLQKYSVAPVLVGLALADSGPPALHRDAPQIVMHAAPHEGRLAAPHGSTAFIPVIQASVSNAILDNQVS